MKETNYKSPVTGSTSHTGGQEEPKTLYRKEKLSNFFFQNNSNKRGGFKYLRLPIYGGVL